jgi:hypothetical protein
MTPYKKNVKTIHRNREESKRIHNGILGREDKAYVYEVFPDKISGRDLHISSNG